MAALLAPHQSPYGRPLASQNNAPIDKSTIIWKDFLHGVKKRKEILVRLKETALQPNNSTASLKRMLLDIRALTLTLIEDALEIEYRAQIFDPRAANKVGKASVKLLPITSYKAMEEKEDVYALADIISDVDDLFVLPNVRVMLPHDFPEHRNPFMLGKTIDELAMLDPPPVEAGNTEMELKVLELLRYKRASKALIRAETQVLNRLPIQLQDIERMLGMMADDINLEKIIRCVCTLLDNDNTNKDGMDANIDCMINPIFNTEPHELMLRMNAFKGRTSMRIDVQAAIRQLLRDCNFDYLDDRGSVFFLEWINSVLGRVDAKKNEESAPKPFLGPGNVVKGSKYDAFGSLAAATNSAVKSPHQSMDKSMSLTMNNMHQHNKKFDDLASDVSVGAESTHENFYEDKRPNTKMSSRSSNVRGDNNEKPPGSNSSGFRPRSTNTPVITTRPARGVRTANAASSPGAEGTVNASQWGFDGGGNVPHTPAGMPPQRPAMTALRTTSQLQSRRQKGDRATSMKGSGGGGIGGGGPLMDEVSANKRIRSEVERILKEVGVLKSLDVVDDDKDDNPDPKGTLNSVRYQLFKMQQELLRKQVLDPKHYKASSVDTTEQKMKGLTVTDNNQSGQQAVQNKKSGAMHQPFTLSQKTLSIGETAVSLEVVMDYSNDLLLGNINPPLAYVSSDGQSIASSSIIVGKKPNFKENIAYMKVSKLMYNKISDNLFDSLLEAKKETKEMMLQPVFEHLHKCAMSKPLPSGYMLLNTDRTLLKKQLSQDGVLVELVILRTDDCDGILVVCTPMASSTFVQSEAGPVTIFISDSELDILLVNQHGLRELSKNKWSAMEAVAQWLSGRVQVTRVKTVETVVAERRAATLRASIEEREHQEWLKEQQMLENESQSQVTFDMTSSIITTRSNEKASDNSGMICPPLPSGDISASPAMVAAASTTGNVGTRVPVSVLSSCASSEYKTDNGDPQVKPMTAAAVSPSRVLTANNLNRTAKNITPLELEALALKMVDVTIDRSIEISDSVKMQWRSRNVPNIAGMEITLTAWQDMDLIRLCISMIMPHPDVFRHAMKKKKKGGDDLMDLDNFEEEDDADAEDEYVDPDEPVAVNLYFSLTGAELQIFGATEGFDQKKVQLSNSRKKNLAHPETFIWNVLSRLSIVFKGSKKTPFHRVCSANDANNWEVKYNRSLLREVKTITKCAMVVTVSATGGELFFEGEPVNNTVFKHIDSKMINEAELTEIAQSEGWSKKMLTYPQRKELAQNLLDKLKIVSENDRHRIEPYMYPESRMLTIIKNTLVPNEPEVNLGVVEINYHFTLNDLRILIMNELDEDELPKHFRFFYKGVSVAVRQEPFRRAWDSLPRAVIVPKLMESKEIALETDDILLKRRMVVAGSGLKADGTPIVKCKYGQRRMVGKWVAVPMPTLCRVQINGTDVQLLHESRDLVQPGDVIRIGSELGRDYVVMDLDKDVASEFPKTIKIDPAFDLSQEPDFNTPLMKNFAWPEKRPGEVMNLEGTKWMRILKNYEEIGYEYTLPPRLDTSEDPELAAIAATAGAVSNEGSRPGTREGMVQTAGGTMRPKSLEDLYGATEEPVETALTVKKPKLKKKKGHEDPIYVDCWMWRAFPAKEDPRPLWRQQYDNGLVHYRYDFAGSDQTVEHFRIKAWFDYMEVLCTDSRVPTFTYHAQRVDFMPQIPLEFYEKLAFENMTNWTPVYVRGIEKTKFIKLMRDVEAFPDLKRPARVAQLDMHFMREVKSENGIVSKYITFAGFQRLMRDVSVLRYPQPRKKRGEDDASSVGKGDGGDDDDDDDNGSVESLDSAGSLGSQSSLKKGGKGGAAVLKSKSNKKTVATTTPGRKGKGGKSDKKTNSPKQQDEQLEERVFVDPNHAAFAYQKFMINFVMAYPDWYESAWQEAKMIAMHKEAIRYCAATRIAAKHRGGYDHHRYKFFLRTFIILQANIRRKLSAKKTQKLVDMMVQDWCYRKRYQAIIVIQSLCRGFLKIAWYKRVMEKLKQQQVLMSKARRFKLAKQRKAAKKGVIYKEAARINGVMVFIKVMRLDIRNYSRNYGISIFVYTPNTQQLYRFDLEEHELRHYMQIELKVPAVSVGDLLDIRNLKKLLASRLIIYKPAVINGRIHQNVILSKHALGQRGERSVTKGMRIAGEFFVCKVFETGEDITVQSYHRLSCRIFNCTKTKAVIREWVISEHKLDNEVADNELAQSEEPPLLLKQNKKQLHLWLLDRLLIDKRKGEFKVVFSIDLQKSKKLDCIIKIQAMWRRSLVRPFIVKLYDAFLVKVHVSAYDHTPYYLNTKTGVSAWVKPVLLGPYDLPTVPTRRWVGVTYYHRGVYTQHYVNPYTGKYTYMVPDQAIKVIQLLVRKFLLYPIKMTMNEFCKAVKLHHSAQKNYIPGQRKLAPVINYALTSHVIDLDEVLAKQLYSEAVDLSEANPLVTRAYAFFMLGTLEAPMLMNRERAQVLLSDAKTKDPDDLKFETAYVLFKYGVLRNPKDVRALVNLALVHCVMYNVNHTAEKLMRRALALEPFNERVMEVWKYLKSQDRFPERQLLYNANARVTRTKTSKGGKKRVVHGREVCDDPQWAGWVYIDEDKFNISKKYKNMAYWYNPADGTETLDQPDFTAEWAVRKARSVYQGDVGTLENYFDPLTSEYFQFHPITNSYA